MSRPVNPTETANETTTAVTRRYREPVEVAVARAERSSQAPVGFTWRGRAYTVVAVLGHWREDAAYWAGGGVEIPQRDLWRLEARNGRSGRGVYELVREGDVWRLDRVWD